MSLGSIAPDRGIMVAAGLFVAVGIAVLAAWFVLTVGRPGARVSFQASLPDVSGLRVGTLVQIAGYPVGAITFISPEHTLPPVAFKVGLAIDPGWQLPTDSSVAAGSDGLLAAPVIALELGQATAMISAGGQIPTRPQPTSLAADVRSVVNEDLKPALREIRSSFRDDLNPTLHAIQQMSESATATIDDTLRPMLADARQIAAEIRAATPGVRQQLEALGHGLAETGKLLDQVGTRDNAERINAVLADIKAATGRLDGIAAAAGQALQATDALLARTDSLVRQNQGGVGSIVRDARFSLGTLAGSLSLILANLERTTQDLSGLAAELRANPGVLLQGRAADRREGVQPR